MKINHHPLFDIAKVTKLYSEKDGIPVKYVCTSSTNATADFACDIYYRSTPHPEFGNNYFGIFRNKFADEATVMITNADSIEKLEFYMIEGQNGFEYSQHRHDYRVVEHNFIDGGRAYLRTQGSYVVKKVVNGEFV
jgi:hypothetical protein|tara:strand:- start:3811 stop:4218 length:408 start_codon:yes stop_codon:yes gene_type:complete